MTGKTHIIGGMTAGLAFASITGGHPLLLFGAGIVGAVLPDICHSGSLIGRRLKPLSKVINAVFGHRTFTHSLLFLLLVGTLLEYTIGNAAVTGGILAGMASHLVLDLITKNGIGLFFPVDVKIKLPFALKTGGPGEKAVFALLSLLTVYFGCLALGFDPLG
ncbi:metal-dependent hydrolase [Indiicoccus explosivorum]|uniref:metal-dependent hydrolase n=1 Tax=Indiicoccus explosivorum TaxID=1917864 RepID=UPI000B450A3E|nr:metal-dependent hydrolase [Indiicoccus explosivorum]